MGIGKLADAQRSCDLEEVRQRVGAPLRNGFIGERNSLVAQHLQFPLSRFCHLQGSFLNSLSEVEKLKRLIDIPNGKCEDVNLLAEQPQSIKKAPFIPVGVVPIVHEVCPLLIIGEEEVAFAILIGLVTQCVGDAGISFEFKQIHYLFIGPFSLSAEEEKKSAGEMVVLKTDEHVSGMLWELER